MTHSGHSQLPASRLERLLGKANSAWEIEDLVRLTCDQGVRLISLMHVGGDGWLKTLDFSPRNEAHLRSILSAGERADGSSIFRGMGIRTEASDILLKPRVSSAFLDPFAPCPSLVLMCGHAGRDGLELPESPDTIVRRAYLRLLQETGIELMALAEVEYFLGKRWREADMYGESERGYHAAAPFVFGETVRREALAILSEIGIPVKYGHSEVGYIGKSEGEERIWEQHEIELNLTPAPIAAEVVAVTQWVLRNLAHKNEMLCSFDPIMRKGHAGSGMHFHFSPVIGGEHMGGRDKDGKLPDPARWLIGGLVKLGGALMAFGNRQEGSFVRLSQGKEAPNTVCWGDSDRKALIRLPIVARDDQGNPLVPPTIEFRLADGSAHPHLLVAGVAQALLFGRDTEGLDELLANTASGTTSAVAPPVPKNFRGIVEALTRNRRAFEAGGVFPAPLIDKLLEAMMPEHPEFKW